MAVELGLGLCLTQAQASGSEDVERAFRVDPSEGQPLMWEAIASSGLKTILTTVMKTPDPFIKVPMTSRGSNGNRVINASWTLRYGAAWEMCHEESISNRIFFLFVFRDEDAKFSP